MKTKVLAYTMLAGMVCCMQLSVWAQNKTYNPKNFKKEPVWIEMMNDPSANYYQTIEAFRAFWEDRQLPKEPFEDPKMETFEKEVGLIGDGETEESRERKLERKKRRKINTETERDYAAQVRAFKGWMQNVKPWVQADGSIISPEEQQRIIDKQQRELKEQEQKQGKK